MSHQKLIHASLVIATIALISLTPARAQTVQIDQTGNQNVQNLAQIALAIHNFSDINNTLPPQYLQTGGSPTLSWRVAILPYLGYPQLYAQFDQTKPWNDPANLPLLQQMPDIFRSPADPLGTTSTRYQAGTGSNTIFSGPTGVKLTSITDGTSNTLLLGESSPATAVPWTQPQDRPIGATPTLSGAGFDSITPTYVPFAFADGSVRFLADNIDSPTLLHLFQYNDGAAIDPAAIHDYTVVPEPTALTLPALGLLALARRRRPRTPV